MKRVVMLSGGGGSRAAAKRVVEKYGTDGLVLLFADTLTEDQDTYRFLIDSARNVFGRPPLPKWVAEVILRMPRWDDTGWKAALAKLAALATRYLTGLVWIADGRTIWEVFRDERMLGGGKLHADPCSKVLKRNMVDRWLRENCDPANTVVYVGIDWSEEHRFTRLRELRAAQGWTYEAPLCEPPYLTKDDLHEWAEREGLRKQRLYVLGMPHANCGGGCVKMGQGGFARLLLADPCRFAEWEENEEKMRQQLGDVSILRDRTGGETKTLTLRQLRERVQSGTVDMFDIGGCGCFTGDAT